MKHWNKCFEMVMKIKEDFILKNPEKKDEKLTIEEMCGELKNSEYNSFIEPLQFVYHIGYKNNDMFVLIRYGLQDMQKGLWEDEDSIYRYCRSIVINLTKNELVIAPMKKFFNLDEVEQTSLTNIEKRIRQGAEIEVTNKLDGSMQNFTCYNEELFGAGSQSLNRNYSWRLNDGYDFLTENQKRMICENKGYTFVFEFISLKDSHVVMYSKEDEGMYLIGIINNDNGIEMPYQIIKEVSAHYGSKCVEIEKISFEDALKLSKTMISSKKEGWVIRIEDIKFKLKCDDYVKLHRVLDKLQSTNVIIMACADNTTDDLLSKLNDTHKKEITETIKEIMDKKQYHERNIKLLYKIIVDVYKDKKDFMMYVTKNVSNKMYAYHLRDYYITKELNWLKIGKKYKKYTDIG